MLPYIQQQDDPRQNIPLVGTWSSGYLDVSPCTTGMPPVSSLSLINNEYQFAPNIPPAASFLDDAIRSRPTRFDTAVSPHGSTNAVIGPPQPRPRYFPQSPLPRQPHSGDRRDRKLAARTNPSPSVLLKPKESVLKPKRPQDESSHAGILQTEFEIDAEQEDKADEDPDLEPHRNNLLERNREAASKCRGRKRDHASTLISREQMLEEQNRALVAQRSSIKQQAVHLRGLLLQHRTCGCELIRKYVAKQSGRSVDELFGRSGVLGNSVDSLSLDEGSSVPGTTDSMGLLSPTTDGVHTPWTNLFPPQSGLPELGDQWFDMSIKQYPQMPIVLDPSAPVVPTMDSHAGFCDGDSYSFLGMQSEFVDKMATGL